jgi:transposase-like protein
MTTQLQTLENARGLVGSRCPHCKSTHTSLVDLVLVSRYDTHPLCARCGLALMRAANKPASPRPAR